MNRKTFSYVQLGVVLGGTIFAWYSVFTDLARFYGTEGTLFKIKECVYPNPIITPCFWGAVLFLIVLFLSAQLAAGGITLVREKRICALLAAGTVFAWGNFGYSFWKFVHAPKGEGVTCSGVPAASPFETPCFYGALFFTAGCVAAFWYVRTLKKDLPA